jgi:hypothetical protein
MAKSQRPIVKNKKKNDTDRLCKERALTMRAPKQGIVHRADEFGRGEAVD